MIGGVDRTSVDRADSVDGYRRRLEEILLVTRWVAVPLCLAMIPFLPKASPIIIGLIAGGLALGNLAIASCLRWASPPRRSGVVSGMATVLEWLAALGMILAGGASPPNPIPAVLILVILIDGLRFGTAGVVGATVAAEVGSDAAVIRQVAVLAVLTPDLGTMVLARWAVIFLAAGLVIGLLLWKGQGWLRQEARRWDRERAALLRRLDDAEQRSNGEQLALLCLRLGISPRERQVLSLLADDLTYEQIAGRLSIELGTVRTHVRHLAAKLGARGGGRRAIVAAARTLGLLPHDE